MGYLYMDEKEARELLKKICDWLENGAPDHDISDISESVTADLARDFSQELLESGRANGLGGCQLCQG